VSKIGGDIGGRKKNFPTPSPKIVTLNFPKFLQYEPKIEFSKNHENVIKF